MTFAIWRITVILQIANVVLNNPLSPKLADKQAIEAELNINGSMFYSSLFLN